MILPVSAKEKIANNLPPALHGLLSDMSRGTAATAAGSVHPVGAFAGPTPGVGAGLGFSSETGHRENKVRTQASTRDDVPAQAVPGTAQGPIVQRMASLLAPSGAASVHPSAAARPAGDSADPAPGMDAALGFASETDHRENKVLSQASAQDDVPAQAAPGTAYQSPIVQRMASLLAPSGAASGHPSAAAR